MEVPTGGVKVYLLAWIRALKHGEMTNRAYGVHGAVKCHAFFNLSIRPYPLVRTGKIGMW